ncbi:hypothetical protein PsYK624_014800 [Phanerochaete sordida]|uniref:Uncharacterized protein n=1 Tax=Phanerochaete sordida TaxID=48140 RepID=A0A9P3FZD0_9APHY|nr:hypothetical protein PsYK624_014800 [Phanerochaete sordida]
MDLSPERALAIMEQPPPVLVRYLAEIFPRIRDTATTGIWIRAYLAAINVTFAELLQRKGPGSGWDVFATTCVQAGVLETLLTLLHHPRDDAGQLLALTFETIQALSSVANASERRNLLDRAVACDAMGLSLRMMQTYDLCYNWYHGARLLTTLLNELGYGTKLAAPECGAIMVLLCRHALEKTDSYAQELLDPTKIWQAGYMAESIHQKMNTTRAPKFGKRWFAYTQNHCMWGVQSLLTRIPPVSRRYALDILKSTPDILDLLLEVAQLPRPDWHPDVAHDEMACETLVQLLRPPWDSIPGLDLPFSGEQKLVLEAEWQASIEALHIFISQPSRLPKIRAICNKLDMEKYDDIIRQVSKVQSDWFGLPSQIKQDMYKIVQIRGRTRIHLLAILTGISYVSSAPTSELISCLPMAYLATKNAGPATYLDHPLETHFREVLRVAEYTVELFRHPHREGVTMNAGVTLDGTCHAPQTRIVAPTALFRLLTVLAQRGALDDASAWPCDGVDLEQVKEILSASTIEELLASTIKGATAQRDVTRTAVTLLPYTARAGYRKIVELATAVVHFDHATRGRFHAKAVGAWKELVVCLGNTAEVSNRLRNFSVAEAYALAAQQAATDAPADAGILKDTLTKNTNRLGTARAGLARG